MHKPKVCRGVVLEILKPAHRIQGALRKEQRALETFKSECSERMDDFRSSLGKVTHHVTVLRSQWAANKAELEELSKQLVPSSQEFAQNVATRLAEAERREEDVWAELKELRESILGLELPHQRTPEDDYGQSPRDIDFLHESI